MKSLPHEGHLVIYGVRASRNPLPVEFIEAEVEDQFPEDLLDVRPVDDLVWVHFCGQKFCVQTMLGSHFVDRQVNEFVNLVQTLNIQGQLLQGGGRKQAQRLQFFVPNRNTALFISASEKLTMFTSWKVEWVSSKTDPAGGLDARVIVPE